MKKILLILLIAFVKQVNAQIIATVAGVGVAGFYGDGGQATNAALAYPWAGTFDAIGNMYITDIGDYRVRKITPSGIISTFAGNGTTGYTGDGGQATAAALNNPIAIAVDGAGNIYISDDGNNVIRKIDASGIITTVVGTGVAGFSGDGGQATAAQLNSQNGIAFDAAGNLYIADGSNNRIRMVNTLGIISTVAGTGTAGFAGDGGQATNAKLQNPSPLAFDTNGNLYVADQTNHIRKINASGIITTIAGNGSTGFSGDGGQATSAEINFPNGMTFDPTGNLYIADFQNNRVRKINTAGAILTIAGNGIQGFNGDGIQANAAELYLPSGVFLDATGNLFIVDEYNNRIRKVTNVTSDTNEVGVPSIISPVFGCSDTIVSPIVKIQNYGTNAITSCIINYQLDNHVVQTYTWTGAITGGQTTNVSLPSFTLTAAGSHTLLCYCSNPNNQTSTFQNIQASIVFNITYPANLPVIEGFETTTAIPNAVWNVSHSSPSGGSDFTFTTLAAATGSKSCLLYNMNNVAGNNSILQTASTYDMTNLTSPTLSFKAAYQQKATTNADKLQIFTSTDCGGSWTAKKLITSTVLASLAGGTNTASYVPSPAEFTTYTVNINSLASYTKVMFRWEFLADPNGVGNNLYIDDINIVDATTGIKTNIDVTDFSIYPNPTKNNFTIETTIGTKQTLQIFDINGRIVLTQLVNSKSIIDVANMPAGVYTLSIIDENTVINKKLIIVK
ncbi:MAG: T9SS type A sorting domain-containing protein [Bacteroidia bacterium]